MSWTSNSAAAGAGAVRPVASELESSRPFPLRWRDLYLVLGVAWAARALFIAVLPAGVHSIDVTYESQLAAALRSGSNPYVTAIQHWPPFHMVLIFCVDHAARTLNLSFFLTLRIFLIVAESLLTLALYLLLTRFAPSETVSRVLLVGVSLNPIAILLVCQHGGFDVFVGLAVVLTLCALTTYRRSRDVVTWLAACLALGFGAYAKSVPLACAPVLAPGARASTRLARWLGVALFVGPAALGLSVVYVMAPHAVTENVFAYRSVPGYFGITGLFDLWGRQRGAHVYELAWVVLALLAVIMLFRTLWKAADSDERQTTLLVSLILMAIPALGPGYAPQYVYWFMPALIVSFVILDRGWRRLLLGCYVVAAATYLTEYALLPSQGAFLLAFFPHSSTLLSLSQRLYHENAQTLLRLPLFFAYLTLLIAGSRRLRLTQQPESSRR